MVVLQKQNILAIGIHCTKAKKLTHTHYSSIIIVSNMPVSSACLDKLHCTTIIPAAHFCNLDNDHSLSLKLRDEESIV